MGGEGVWQEVRGEGVWQEVGGCEEGVAVSVRL